MIKRGGLVAVKHKNVHEFVEHIKTFVPDKNTSQRIQDMAKEHLEALDLDKFVLYVEGIEINLKENR